ncbi:MAG: hypothetical protein ABF334_08270, partial [Akkermansiaceae bacterium]
MFTRLFLVLTLSTHAAGPAELLKEIETLESATFSSEKEARHFENEGIVALWDQLLTAPRGKRIDLLASLPFNSLTLGKVEREFPQDLNIQVAQLTAGGSTLTPLEWKFWLAPFQKNGLEIT